MRLLIIGHWEGGKLRQRTVSCVSMSPEEVKGFPLLNFSIATMNARELRKGLVPISKLNIQYVIQEIINFMYVTTQMTPPLLLNKSSLEGLQGRIDRWTHAGPD